MASVKIDKESASSAGCSSWRASKRSVLAVSSFAIFNDMFLFGAVIPIQKKILLQFSQASNHEMSLLFASYAVGLLLFTPIFGVFSDRLSNRQIPMLVGIMALIASIILFLYANSFPQLIMARFFQGISASATWVVGLAMLTDSYVSDGLGFATSLAFNSQSVGYFFGPLAGGFLSRYYGIKTPFFLCLFLTILDFFGRLIIKPIKPHRIRTKAGDSFGKEDLPDVSLWNLLTNLQVLLVLGAVVIGSSSFSSIEASISDHVMKVFGLDEFQTALSLLGFNLPSIFVSILVGYAADTFSPHYIITVGLVVNALALPIAVFSNNFAVFLTGSILYSICSTVLSTPCTPELAHVVDQLGGASFARIYAIFNMFYSIGMIIGPLVVSYIEEKISLFWGLAFLSGLALVYAPIFLFGFIWAARRNRMLNRHTNILTMSTTVLTSTSALTGIS